jgi:hypothetical protein
MAFEPVSPIDYRSLHVGTEWADDDRLVTTSGSGTRNVQITPVTVTTGAAMSGVVSLTVTSGVSANAGTFTSGVSANAGTFTSGATFHGGALSLAQATGGLSGADAALLTGTAGTSGNVAVWNTDGDVVGGTAADTELVTASGTLTNNTIPKGDGARGLADSSITDDGSSVTVSSGVSFQMDSTTVFDTNGLLNARSYAVASLPAAGTAGRVAYASDGRKAGEGAGSGTGVLVFDDGSNWIAVDTGATVAA